jgi:hypothetical protein
VAEENDLISSQIPTSGSYASHTSDASTSTAKQRRRTGYGRLIWWALPRLLWSLLVLVVPIGFLAVVYHDASSWSPTTATVVTSRSISGSLANPRRQLDVIVTLISPTDGIPISGDVEPKFLRAVYPGQRIPVTYYHNGLRTAVLYAGPGGDVRQANYDTDYAVVAVLIVFAIIPLVMGSFRCLQMVIAAKVPIMKPLHVIEVSGGRWVRRLRAYDACVGMDLEWRVLRWQPRVTGIVAVGGHLESGGWLVIRLPGKGLIWPSSRAQPVIGTGMQRLPQSDEDTSPVINAHYRLYAAYVQLISDVERLPFIVRRPPGQRSQSRWWWLGAPRVVVRSLVTSHVRRRLQTLGSALTRAGALVGVVYYDTTRSELYAASQECRALAATLPRSIWRAVTVFLIVTALPASLTIYTAFIEAAPIHVKFTIAPGLLLAIAILVIIPTPFLFTRSVGCKRVMFYPALNAAASLNKPIASSEQWDVYQLEREAFLCAGLSSPSEWETRFWIRGLVLELYILTIFIPLLFTGDFIYAVELLLGTLALSVLTAGVSVIADVGGIFAFIQLHRNGQTSG